MTFFVYAGYERTLGIWALGEIGGDQGMDTLAKLAASLKPVDSMENIEAACAALRRFQYKKAANPLISAIANKKLCLPGHQKVLADTVQALGEARPATEPVQTAEVYDRFFLNVKE